MSQLKQEEFIWELRSFYVEQQENGLTVATIRPCLLITHNHLKGNKIHILFSDENLRFIVPTKESLRYLISLNLSCRTSMQPMKDYCKSHLVPD